MIAVLYTSHCILHPHNLFDIKLSFLELLVVFLVIGKLFPLQTQIHCYEIFNHFDT